MATDFSKPLVGDTYASILPMIKAAFQDVARQLDPDYTGVHTNVVTRTTRWRSAVKKWELYNGTSWVDLADKYAISISGNADTATAATTAGSATTAGTATNLAAGTAGSMPYQSGAGATAMLGIGSAGAIMTVSGGGLPVWTSPSSISVNYATSAGSAGVASLAADSDKLGGVNAANFAQMGVSNTWTAKQVYTGYQKIQATLEKMTVASLAAGGGVVQYDVNTQSALYFLNNATANFTINFRASGGTSLDSVLATGEAITVVFLNTNGATPYYPTAITVDGAAVTPKWQGGLAPTFGYANSVDAYTYTIIKTATATFTVLAGQSQFK